MSRIRILHLEDSPLDAELVAARLAREGLDATIDRVETREEFCAALDEPAYGLILADYSLPSFDGLSALALAHERRAELPFLFVSGTLGEEVAIDTLKRGATDYVVKARLERLGPAVARALSEAGERAERRRAEAALEVSERNHRLVLESLRDYAIITLDLGGRITGWNRGAEAVLGYREAEMLGGAGAVIFTPEDRRRGVPEAELARAEDEGRAEDERWHERKDGGRFWANGVLRPLRDEAGSVRGFVKVLRDMTAQKCAEEALREADRRKDEFLAILAHELRNPLSAIHNAIQLVHRTDRTEDFAWAKGVIAKQVKHLAHIVDDLLDLSRINRGKFQLRPSPQDAAALVRGATEVVRPLIESRRHSLAIAVEPSPLTVMADATRLEQVLVNLLTNAAKYTPEGGEIAIEARRDGDDVLFRVRDNGEGIPAEILPRIFEPFTQAQQTIDRSLGGLGIGLTLARQLVEMHDGSISAGSDGSGRGSEFLVRLPRAADPARADGAAAPAAPAAAPKPYVLVVDDNIEAADGLSRILETHGYRVRTAFDGPSALAAAAESHPDIILLDIGLPGLDGYQVAERIRRDSSLKGALLVALTGYGQEDARRRSGIAGFDHHLIKPVDFDKLFSILAYPGPHEVVAD